MTEIKQKPINILLLEDVDVYRGSFKTLAQKERIIVKDFDNVEDILGEIRNYPKKYQFLVLDARAYMQEGQKEGTEDEMNLVRLLTELRDLKHNYGIHIPYCINTGFSDLKLRLRQIVVDCPIFEKGNEKDLFAHIWDTYSKSDRAKLINAYPGIFGFVFDVFADVEAETIADLFIGDKFKSKLVPTRKNNLNCLRGTAEHLIDILHRDFLNGAPNIISTPGRRLGEVADHIWNNQDMPVHVYSVLTAIRKVAGEYGAHNPQTPQQENEYPSEDYITGLALSLRDVFSWAETKLK